MEGAHVVKEVNLIDFSDNEERLQESNSSQILPASSKSKKRIQNDPKKNLLIKVDIDEIIVNTKENEEYPFKCGALALLVKYQRSEISLCLFGFKDELVIPFNQLKGIKMGKSKVLEISVPHGFRREYHIHSDGFPYKKNPRVTSSDPTQGIFTNAIGFKLRPKDWEHENKIALVEAGLNSLCFTNFGRENKLLISKLLFDEDELPKITLAEGEIGFMCIFRGTKLPLSFPYDGTFSEFLDVIREKFDYFPEWVQYLDPTFDDRITVVDDQDWILAKSVNYRMKRPKDTFIKIYLS
ncbi:11247_t:CDS:2 [Acaulospora morrowiae]|uniref:11247_t:CDS:1 n=1 Tax=Acaulospora morrowiae TaxID=94023 RepID=A0A9N8VSX2_9GLOM|nr:11247_t:CDS:2 [Acaulospora morrowiae]